MGRLSQREIDELVREPVISVLSTIRPDGSPHMTPVWHLWDDGEVVIAVEELSVKARNVRHELKVALCVATAETPQRWALVNGTAVLSDEAVSEMVWAVSVHYLGHQKGRAHAEKVLATLDFILIRITPTGMIGFVGE